MNMPSCRWTLPLLALSSAAWAGETRLLQPDPYPNDGIGWTVDVSGSTAVVGHALADINGPSSGAVYVYEKVDGIWGLPSVVTAPDGAAGDAFGYSVALDGDTLVVGAWLDQTLAGLRSGSAYVFVRDGAGWTFQAKLRPSDHEPNDRFGLAVDVHGDTLAVGSGNDLDDQPRNYIFRRDGAIWTEEAGIVAGELRDRVLAVSDDRLVVAREGVHVWVYHRSDGSWPLEVEFGHGDPPWVITGWAADVAIEDDMIVVLGRYQSALVFEYSQGALLQTATIENPPGGAQSYRLDLSAGRLLVSYSGSGPQASRVYERSGTAWTQVHELLPASPPSFFGLASAISGAEVVIGCRANGAPGEVYAFTLPGESNAMCDGSDGALALCPCANPGAPDTGCDIQQATGGVRLDIAGQEVGPQNRATALGTGFPPTFTPSATLMRSSSRHPDGAVAFGDGVFCLSSPIVRLGGAIAVDGHTSHVFGHGAMAGVGTFFYQLHFRNTPAMYCTPEAFNLSSGRTLEW